MPVDDFERAWLAIDRITRAMLAIPCKSCGHEFEHHGSHRERHRCGFVGCPCEGFCPASPRRCNAIYSLKRHSRVTARRACREAVESTVRVRAPRAALGHRGRVVLRARHAHGAPREDASQVGVQPCFCTRLQATRRRLPQRPRLRTRCVGTRATGEIFPDGAPSKDSRRSPRALQPSRTTLASLAKQNKRVATIERRVCAISQAHQLQNFPTPTIQAQVRAVGAGIRRTVGTAPVQKAAAVIEQLREMVGSAPTVPVPAGAAEAGSGGAGQGRW